ncbi:hypothetical protein ACWATR_35380 [Nostoc sp. UIC 10890]
MAWWRGQFGACGTGLAISKRIERLASLTTFLQKALRESNHLQISYQAQALDQGSLERVIKRR